MTKKRGKDRKTDPSAREGGAKGPAEDSFANWADGNEDVNRLTGDDRHGPYRAEKTLPPRPGVDSRPPTPDPLQFPDENEPLLARRPHVSKNRFRQLRSGKIPPGRRLDLHGHDRHSARRILIATIESAASSGTECVLVIHGKGNRSDTGEAVLRQSMPEWLSSPDLRGLVVAFSPAAARDGGAGAVYVLLS